MPGNVNPHQPRTLVWEVLNKEGNAVWAIQGYYPLGTWWPDLHPDFCQLVAEKDKWDLGCITEARSCLLQRVEFYVCPQRDQKGKLITRCGNANDYYCSVWGCETTGQASWNPSSSWDWIKVTRREPALGEDRCRQGQACQQQHCNALKISFTKSGQQLSKIADWIRGRTWGFRLHLTVNRGFLFQVRLRINPVPTTASLEPVFPKIRNDQTAGPSISLTVPTPASHLSKRPSTLFNLILGAYSVLNATQNELTKSCWLCLSSAPPYYEGIAIDGNYTVSNGSQCSWKDTHQLTVQEVTGQGLCVGTVPSDRQYLCATTQTIAFTEAGKYLLPTPGSWWACNTGLTPCISTSVFQQTHYCVMIRLYPRVLYHDDQTFEDQVIGIGRRFRREPITITLAVLLGAGVAAGVGTGAAALIRETEQIDQLDTAIRQDLREIETSVKALKDSLVSLSEVVLQNRRGLNLLFEQEGGLCVALKEQCCYYSDHTGVIQESMDRLEKRLDERKRRSQAQEGWFQSWFNSSPWLTTLLSAITGPLIVLLLLLTIGPCVVNKLLAFINERIGAVKLMIIKQQYQQLEGGEVIKLYD